MTGAVDAYQGISLSLELLSQLFYTLIYQTVCVHFQHNSEIVCATKENPDRLKINSSSNKNINKKSGSIDLNHNLMLICHLDVFVLCLAGCLFILKYAHAMHITRTQIPSNPIQIIAHNTIKCKRTCNIHFLMLQLKSNTFPAKRMLVN